MFCHVICDQMKLLYQVSPALYNNDRVMCCRYCVHLLRYVYLIIDIDFLGDVIVNPKGLHIKDVVRTVADE